MSQIVQKVLKNKDALDEIHSHRDEDLRQRSITKSIVEDMVEKKVHIDSARTVQVRVQ